MGKRERIDWSKVEDLGKVPDGVIARRLGCDASVVWRARTKRKINSIYRDWDAVEDLGKTWDKDIAERLGVAEAGVCGARKVRNIPCYSPVSTCIVCGVTIRLRAPNHVTCGTTYCSRIARNAAYFFNLESMQELNPTLFKAYRETIKVSSERLGLRKKGIDWDNAPLGILSDAEIACQYGCSKPSVQSARRVRGIPPVGRPEKIERYSTL